MINAFYPPQLRRYKTALVNCLGIHEPRRYLPFCLNVKAPLILPETQQEYAAASMPRRDKVFHQGYPLVRTVSRNTRSLSQLVSGLAFTTLLYPRLLFP